MNQNPVALTPHSPKSHFFPTKIHISYLKTLSRNKPIYLLTNSLPLLNRHLFCFSENNFDVCLYNHFFKALEHCSVKFLTWVI